MAKRRKAPAEDAQEEEAEQRTVRTMVLLTLENRRYLFVRKAEGKGSVSEQVNKLVQGARAAGWE